MPSIISGYDYDIFISYGHNDNKGDHWVTDFVSALKTDSKPPSKKTFLFISTSTPLLSARNPEMLRQIKKDGNKKFSFGFLIYANQ
ncbi:MAG: hypothetical protein AABY93_05785 [Bacteroidota bacterium]